MKDETLAGKLAAAPHHPKAPAIALPGSPVAGGTCRLWTAFGTWIAASVRPVDEEMVALKFMVLQLRLMLDLYVW